MSYSSVPLAHLMILFSFIILMGLALILPLFKFNFQKLVDSGLFTKIVFWIPIFLVFIVVLYAHNPLRLALLVALLVVSLVEFYLVVRKSKNEVVPLAVYFLLFVIGMTYFYFLGSHYQSQFINLLITLGFATALSDVMAFFFGSYRGKHKLPGWLNSHKSWEGILGQLLGALLGVILVSAFVVPIATIWLFLPIGLGSALGDLINSFAKRLAGIRNWSNAIPGHGGFIDRLSSVAGSAALMFYYLKVTGVL